MPARIDLAAYFDRIQWRGPAEPTYATLAGLLEAHTAAIPFENFDVLLGRPVRLDLPALQAKLIGARRGGYCFEHATLFAAVLEAIGFAPQRHAARVTIFQPAAEAARTHMFLTVPLAHARYVVDPGFGLFGARQPLPLDGPGTATHRMAQQDGAWVLYATRDGAPFPAWVSTLDIEHPIDAEVANHYVATHPGSPFTTMILASAITPGGRVNIMNDTVTVLGAAATQSRLPGRTALRAVLAEHFGFDLPAVETMPVPAIPGWT